MSENSDNTPDNLTELLMNILRESKYGMSIADMSRKTGLSRNTVVKYLMILQTLGQAEIQKVGSAQVYHLSNRIPITKNWLRTVPIPYVLISDDSSVKDTNERFCKEFGLTRDNILRENIIQTDIEILKSIADTQSFKMAVHGEIYENTGFEKAKSGTREYLTWIYPVVIFDGSRGILCSLTQA